MVHQTTKTAETTFNIETSNRTTDNDTYVFSPAPSDSDESYCSYDSIEDMDYGCPCQGTNWDDCCSDCRWSQEYGYERFPTSKLSSLEAPPPQRYSSSLLSIKAYLANQSGQPPSILQAHLTERAHPAHQFLDNKGAGIPITLTFQIRGIPIQLELCQPQPQPDPCHKLQWNKVMDELVYTFVITTRDSLYSDYTPDRQVKPSKTCLIVIAKHVNKLTRLCPQRTAEAEEPEEPKSPSIKLVSLLEAHQVELAQQAQPDPLPQHQSDPQPLSDNSFGFEYILNGKLNRTYYSNENQKRLAEFTGRELDIFHEIQKGPKKGTMVKHRVNLNTLKVTNLENHVEHHLLVPEAMWQKAKDDIDDLMFNVQN
jgi:hypothetical protein